MHNLEHGSVVVLYRCPSPEECASDAEMALMQQWFNEAPATPTCAKQAIAARFDQMDTRFAIVAWGRALLMDEFNLDTALTFAQQWTDHGAVPEQALC